MHLRVRVSVSVCGACVRVEWACACLRVSVHMWRRHSDLVSASVSQSVSEREGVSGCGAVGLMCLLVTHLRVSACGGVCALSLYAAVSRLERLQCKLDAIT